MEMARGWSFFFFFDLVGKDAQGKRFDLRHRFLPGAAVRTRTSGKGGDFGDPAPVVFAIQFNLKLQSHLSTQTLTNAIVEHRTERVNTAVRHGRDARATSCRGAGLNWENQPQICRAR